MIRSQPCQDYRRELSDINEKKQHIDQKKKDVSVWPKQLLVSILK